MVGSIGFHMINFIMWVVTARSWDSCREILRILIKEPFAINFLFFTMRLPTLRAIRLILTDSWAFKSFCIRLNLLEIGILPQLEVYLMLRTLLFVLGLIELAQEIIGAYIDNSIQGGGRSFKFFIVGSKKEPLLVTYRLVWPLPYFIFLSAAIFAGSRYYLKG